MDSGLANSVFGDRSDICLVAEFGLARHAFCLGVESAKSLLDPPSSSGQLEVNELSSFCDVSYIEVERLAHDYKLQLDQRPIDEGSSSLTESVHPDCMNWTVSFIE